MTHSTNWNIDDYKIPTESREQWELRRKFMERWKQDFVEDRLVCLARVFINVEFLNCRYPAAVMAQVAELSKEIAKDFRAKRSKRLQPTFVSASKAAEDRVKRTHAMVETSSHRTAPGKKICFVSPSSNKLEIDTQLDSKSTYNIDDNIHNSGNCYSQYSSDVQKANMSRQNNFKKSKFTSVNHEYAQKNKINILTKYGRLILYSRPANSFISNIMNSCQSCKISVNWDFTKSDTWSCRCIINNIHVSTGNGETQKAAKEKAAEESWNILQKECHMIIVQQSHVSKDNKTISIKEVENKNCSITDKLDTKVESAVASRIMKLMGWKGGALGVSGDGISEPIAPNFKHITRMGLGSNTQNTFIKQAVRKTIHEFKDSSAMDYDLVFANDFTKEERAEMHKIALRCGLKSKSYGQDNERYLVISKYLSPEQLVQSLHNSGGSNEKFRLVYPAG